MIYSIQPFVKKNRHGEIRIDDTSIRMLQLRSWGAVGTPTNTGATMNSPLRFTVHNTIR